MGRAKHDWMLLQEQEVMYEWIEENYPKVVGHEDSPQWDEAVQAFEDYCKNQQRLEQEIHWQEEYDYYVHLTLRDANSKLNGDLAELNAMLGHMSDGGFNRTFFKMIYAHSVTVLEVYLEDVAKALIMSSEAYLKNTIKNVRPFCDAKFKLGDISLEGDGIKKFVLGKLSDNLFHDIPKVLKIISGIVDKNLEQEMEISKICTITSTRHDIVHRNGMNKDGNAIEITELKLQEALSTVEEFTSQIRQKLSEM
jgi:hypothetical protein